MEIILNKHRFKKGDRVWDVFRGLGTVEEIVTDPHEVHYTINYDEFKNSDLINRTVPQHILRTEEEYERLTQEYDKN